MEKQPKVFIIVLNYNEKEATAECITSLQNINYKNYEIVVIDNGSKDNPAEYLRGQFPYIKIIVNDRNLGYAGGNNVGIRHALKQGCDFVLLLNNDVVVSEDFLGILVKKAASDEKAGITGPLIYYYKGKKINFAGGYLDKRTYTPLIRGYKTEDSGKFNNAEEVDYISGACLLIKKELFERLGLLKEDYFLLWEETDFCARAKKAGYKVIFNPASLIWHKESASFKHIHPEAYDYYQTRNKLLFLKNNIENSALLRLNIALQSVVAACKLFKKRMPLKAKAVFLAVRDYYTGRYGKRY